VCRSRFTTITLNYGRARINCLRGQHLHNAATKKTATGHPHGHNKGQENSRDFAEQGRSHRQKSTPKNTKVQRPRKCYVTDGLVALLAEKHMSIDKDKIKTQDDLNEPAPMDQADERARAEMERLEREAKKEVAESLRQTDEDDD
jgi:hypothetical protein